MDPLTAISTRTTPQTQPVPAMKGADRQVRNSAGGYVFTVGDLARFRRFLTIGTEGATYYTSSAELTRANAEVLFRLAETNHAAALEAVIEISEAGRAPKQNPAIFALAVLCSIGTDDERGAALQALPRVCRTGTHLFLFAGYVEQFRGWGRALVRAVASWYLDQDVDRLAYQIAKYGERNGWSHRDLLRLAHPVTTEPIRNAVFTRVAQPDSVRLTGADLPSALEGRDRLARARSVEEVVAVIAQTDVSWEMVPDEFINFPAVWEALLDRGRVPATALMRQLGRLTRIGILSPLGTRTGEIAARLADPVALTKARVHPVNVLVALRTYQQGHSMRGETTWSPVARIVDALDAGFYAAFGGVRPAGKRTMQALDVSMSMSTSTIANMPLTPREASAALALVTMATEPSTFTVAFSDGQLGGGYCGSYRRGGSSLEPIVPLDISPRQRLDDVIRRVSNLNFGATDCSLPMLAALENRLEVDTFVIYTDNETWAGAMHPFQALEKYRQATGIDAKLVVVAMTPTEFSIARPEDPGMLDVAGFDSAVPQLITDFSRGL